MKKSSNLQIAENHIYSRTVIACSTFRRVRHRNVELLHIYVCREFEPKLRILSDNSDLSIVNIVGIWYLCMLYPFSLICSVSMGSKVLTSKLRTSP